MTLIDAAQVNDGVIESELAIVGTGAAGLALAREFAGTGIQVALLEAGGLRASRRAQADYRGRNTGRTNIGLATSRVRCFGGSTTVWGGQSRPLDPLDFEERDGIAWSGWPFDFAHLAPFYQRAQAFCQLGPFDYQPPPSLRIASDLLTTRLYQFSHPVNLAQVHRQAIEEAVNIRVYLNANLVSIQPDHDGSRVRELMVARGTGHPIPVRARCYVLACGGIENPRLLLANGLGNAHDLCGRTFMDHPYVFPGYVEPSRPGFPPEGWVIGGYPPVERQHSALGLPDRLIRSERLNGASLYLVRRARYKTSGAYWSPGGRALLHLIEIVQRREEADGRLGQDVSDLFSDLPNVVRTAWGRVQGLWDRDDVLAMRIAIEATPCRESRVRLGKTTDRWGIPRPELEWRLNDRDRAGYERLLEVLRAELPRLGLGRLVEHGRYDPDGWPSGMIGGKHHMGTTRMHPDPRLGVVDPDGRVHNMENLFLAGSSVFPTGGYANPTLTIAALAIRLADRLKATLRPGH